MSDTESQETTTTDAAEDTSTATSTTAQEQGKPASEDSNKNDLNENAKQDIAAGINKLGLLNDLSVMLTIEIGRANIKIKDLLNLSKGSIIELDKLAGDPVSIYANGRLIAMGNIITANGKYCVRLISINNNAPPGAETK